MARSSTRCSGCLWLVFLAGCGLESHLAEREAEARAALLEAQAAEAVPAQAAFQVAAVPQVGGPAPVVSADRNPADGQLALAAQQVAAAPQPAAPMSVSSFVFPADGVGGILKERLPPPRQSPLPPVSIVSAPQSGPITPAEKTLRKMLKLQPLLGTPFAARLTKQDSGLIERPQAATDAPPLSLSAEPRRAGEIYLPLAARVFAPAPDAQAIPPLASLSRPGSTPPALTDDPGLIASRVVTLPRTSSVRGPVKPLFDLAAPDPFQLEREIQLRTPPADVDLPAGSIELPTRQTLPVEAKQP